MKWSSLPANARAVCAWAAVSSLSPRAWAKAAAHNAEPGHEPLVAVRRDGGEMGPRPGHDVDEKISVDDLQRGARVLVQTLTELATGPKMEKPFGK